MRSLNRKNDYIKTLKKANNGVSRRRKHENKPSMTSTPCGNSNHQPKQESNDNQRASHHDNIIGLDQLDDTIEMDQLDESYIEALLKEDDFNTSLKINYENKRSITSIPFKNRDRQPKQEKKRQILRRL